MKKLLITCGIAIAAIGIYSGAFAENTRNSAILASEIQAFQEGNPNFQDTVPKRKRDTTNRKPMPKDTAKKDTLKAAVSLK